MKILRTLLWLVGMAYAGFAQAHTLDYLHPYIGGAFLYEHVKGEKEYANVLNKNYLGGDVFIGVRFFENLGIEIGYDDSGKRTTNFSAVTLSGRNYPLGINVQNRFRGFHGDVLGFLPLSDSTDLIGTVGIRALKSKMTATSGGVDLDASGETKAVFRAGGGAQYFVTEYVGVRAMVRYENFSSLEINLNDLNGNKHRIKPFEDGFSVALGVIVKF